MLVEDLLDQLRWEFIKVNILQACLDAIIAFLGMNFVLYITGFQLMSQVSNLKSVGIVALIVFLGDLYYRVQTYRLELYERNNPELREILRTSRDNLDQRGTVAEALFNDLFTRTRHVTSDSIIPTRVLVIKILVVGLLSFVTMFSGLVDVQIQRDAGDILPNAGDVLGGDSKRNDSVSLRNGSAILGERTDMRAADMNLSVTMRGEGKADNTGGLATYTGDGEDPVLEQSGQSLEDDLDLAKAYSVRIREQDFGTE